MAYRHRVNFSSNSKNILFSGLFDIDLDSRAPQHHQRALEKFLPSRPINCLDLVHNPLPTPIHPNESLSTVLLMSVDKNSKWSSILHCLVLIPINFSNSPIPENAHLLTVNHNCYSTHKTKCHPHWTMAQHLFHSVFVAPRTPVEHNSWQQSSRFYEI